MLDVLSDTIIDDVGTRTRPVVARRRRRRRWPVLRRATGWLLLMGWISLPLLPIGALLLSHYLGIGLF